MKHAKIIGILVLLALGIWMAWPETIGTSDETVSQSNKESEDDHGENTHISRRKGIVYVKGMGGIHYDKVIKQADLKQWCNDFIPQEGMNLRTTIKVDVYLEGDKIVHMSKNRGLYKTEKSLKKEKDFKSRKSRLYKEESPHHIPAPMTPLFAAVNWLEISINLLLVIHVIICLLLALLVLMQRPKQEGLGAAFGSGLTDQAFGARTTDVLQKGTVYLGTLFFVVTLVLAILIGKRQNAIPSMADTTKPATEEKAAVPVLPADKTPAVMPDVDQVDPTPKAPVAPTPTPPAPAEPVKPTEKPEAPAEPAAEGDQ